MATQERHSDVSTRAAVRLRGALGFTTVCLISLTVGCGMSIPRDPGTADTAERSGVVCGIAARGGGHAVVCARRTAIEISTDGLSAVTGLPSAVGRWRSGSGADWCLDIGLDGHYRMEVAHAETDRGVVSVNGDRMTFFSFRTGHRDHYRWLIIDETPPVLYLDGSPWIAVPGAIIDPDR
jgi:hypothetical protein